MSKLAQQPQQPKQPAAAQQANVDYGPPVYLEDDLLKNDRDQQFAQQRQQQQVQQQAQQDQQRQQNIANGVYTGLDGGLGLRQARSGWSRQDLLDFKKIPIAGEDGTTEEFVNAWWQARGGVFNGRTRADIEREAFDPNRQEEYRKKYHPDPPGFWKNLFGMVPKSTAAAPSDPIEELHYRVANRPEDFQQTRQQLARTNAQLAGTGRVVGQIYEHNMFGRIFDHWYRKFTGKGLVESSMGADINGLGDEMEKDYIRSGMSEEDARFWRRANDWAGYGAAAGSEALNWIAGQQAAAGLAGMSSVAAANGARGVAAGTRLLGTYLSTKPVGESLKLTAQAWREQGLNPASNKWALGANAMLEGLGTFIGDQWKWQASGMALGRIANFIRGSAVGGALGMTRAGQAASKLFNYATTPSKLPYLSFAGAANRTGKFIANQFLVSSPKWGFTNAMTKAMDGEMPTFSDINPITNAPAVALPLMPFQVAAQLSTQGNPILAANSNEFAKEKQRLMKELDDPAKQQQYIREWGLPQDSTPEQVKQFAESVYMPIARTTQLNARTMQLLDPSVKWDTMSPEQQEQTIQQGIASGKYTEKQLIDAQYGSAYGDMLMGAGADLSALDNPDFTPEQRKKLIKAFIVAEHQRTGGWKITEALAPGMTLKNTMDKSPEAKQAVVAYTRGALQDIVDGKVDPSSVDVGELTGVLNKLSQDEVDNMFMHVSTDEEGYTHITGAMATCSAEQALDLISKGGSALGADGKVRKAYTNALQLRMMYDSNFIADYIPALSGALEGGMNLSKEELSDAFTQIVDSLDPTETLNSMDDDHVFKLARFITSAEGQSKLEGLGEQGEALRQAWTDAAQQRVVGAAMSSPLKGMPLLASLWAKSKGWEGAGSLLGNPLCFWMMALLVIGGGLWLGKSMLGGSSDKQKTEQTAQPRQLLFSSLPGYGSLE